jgi:hypothetical protein
MLMLIESSIKKLGNVTNLDCHVGQRSLLLVRRSVAGVEYGTGTR